MDKTAFFTMTSGLYVVSAAAGDRKAGCVVNTAVQVTSSPARISVAVNKENFSAGVIADAGAFAVTVIDQTADMIYIGNFGFRTSANFDNSNAMRSARLLLVRLMCPSMRRRCSRAVWWKLSTWARICFLLARLRMRRGFPTKLRLPMTTITKSLKERHRPRRPRMWSRDCANMA